MNIQDTATKYKIHGIVLMHLFNEISPQISDEASSKNFTELRVFNEYPRYSYEIQDTWHSTDASLNEISPQISNEASSKDFSELRVFNEYPRYSYEKQDT